MKRLTALLLLTTLFFGLVQAQMFTINARIDGVSGGTAELQAREGRTMVTKFATGIKEDGSFQMIGKITEPDLYYLKVGDARGTLSLFMCNVPIEISGASDRLYESDIQAQGATGDFQAYNNMLRARSNDNRDLFTAYSEARKAEDEEKVAELRKELDVYYEENGKLEMQFIEDNLQSAVAPYLVYRKAYQMDDPNELEALINGFNPKMADHKYVTELKETLEIKRITAVGAEAPDFTQNDVDGNPVSLSDFRGKYVLVDFWAAWCGPCRGENPNVVEAYNKFRRKGFTVLGVSLDRTKEDWLKAIEEDGLTWTQVSDLQYWDNAVAKQYGIRAIPSNLLIDKKGIIVGKNLRGEDLHKKLEEIL